MRKVELTLAEKDQEMSQVACQNTTLKAENEGLKKRNRELEVYQREYEKESEKEVPNYYNKKLII